MAIDDETLIAAARSLAEHASSPARVLLFGSAARTPGAANDLDFLVIEEHLTSKLAEMVRLRDALPPLGMPVDVIVASEDEVRRRGKARSSLISRALAEGRVLVER